MDSAGLVAKLRLQILLKDLFLIFIVELHDGNDNCRGSLTFPGLR